LETAEASCTQTSLAKIQIEIPNSRGCEKR
jgi:hypothetical protein